MKSTLLEKSFRILERVATASEPVTLKELAADLNLNTSTVSRIAADLTERHLIRKAGYHSFVPSTALFRLGEHARNTPLIRTVSPLLTSRALELNINISLACIESGDLLCLASCGPDAGDKKPPAFPLWRSPQAAVILGKINQPETAENFFRRATENTASKLNLQQEQIFFKNLCRSAAATGCIIQKDPRTGWNVSFPIAAADDFFGLSLFGKDVDKCNIERMQFEGSRLASRLTSAINALFY